MDKAEQFKKINTFILDMDGVLTDGKVLVLENGLQARVMSIRDGYAIQLAVKKGYHVCIVSGAESVPVVERLRKLGVTEVYMAVKEKGVFIGDYCRERGISRDRVLFMGDDMPDLPVAGVAGLFCCPSDAIVEIVEVADYISPIAGGQGCVRDVIEQVLKLNDHWNNDLNVTSS
ncbi:MAG: 3-deoxy-D-manno-octulosonate 8-phosphate phosphatase [Chitinophagaceae bacterium]|nr:MAG: 3-deoxy-D-manno-octulosonate 8-phosphate phosphatase [Chitinophagaceae bacterium]